MDARPRPYKAAADAFGVRRPPTPGRADPADNQLHCAGHGPGAPQLAHACSGIAPVVRSATDFHEPRRGQSGRRFASTTLELADVKQTGMHLGVTINDLVLAMSTGALRTLLLRYDGKADPLLATVPVRLDLFPDRISGNFVDTMSVALPVDLEDPLERIRRCRENAISAKEIQQLRGPELVHRWLTYTTPVALEAFFRLAFRRKAVSKMPHLRVSNVAISNIPGLVEHGRVGGALLTDFYMVGPLAAWSGLLITVQSYVDQLNISVLTDDATVKDPHEVTEAMNAEFIEIRRSPAFPNS